MSELTDVIDRQIDYIEQQRAVVKAAHLLLTWTHQYAINSEKMPERGWWHINDLHPGVFNKMNSAERDLFVALQKLEAPPSVSQADEINSQ